MIYVFLVDLYVVTTVVAANLLFLILLSLCAFAKVKDLA